jgi:hypothetical protein
MRKLFFIFLVVSVLAPLSALKTGGVNLPDRVKFGEEELVINGGGLRKKLIIKVYACGLYLPQKQTDSETILSDTTAIAVRMHFIYKEVDQSALIEAWNAGFAKTGALQQFAIEAAQFNALFNEPAKKGDIYDIVYLPKTGLQVIKNGSLLGTIESTGFRRAVYSIWLHPETDLPKLRQELLGI